MSSLNNLIQKLAGAQTVESKTEPSGDVPENGESTTDPVYVEKLASAVDFILDGWSGAAPQLEEEPEKVASVSDISDKLRDKLKNKLAEKREEESEHDSDFVDSILEKLQELKADRVHQEEEASDESAEEVSQLNLASDTEEEEEEEEEIEETPSSEESEEEVTDDSVAKAASVESSSLADVLRAALSTANEHDESVEESSESAKTANVLGSDGPMARKEATELLKKKLMAKSGQEV